LDDCLFQVAAVVTTSTDCVNGLNTTPSGAMCFKAEGTSATPWPHPTNATWVATLRTSWRMRGENPLAWHKAMRLSK
jgi:hypothetical protein